MSFVLGAEERPGAGLERTIREQVKKLLTDCDAAAEGPASFAHKARVRTKKIRAALRLARPLIGRKAYRRANRWWRDAARALSALRDQGARLEALQMLEPFLKQRIGTAMMERLTDRFEGGQQSVNAAAAIEAFCTRVRPAEALLLDMPSGSRDEAIAALVGTYRAARQAMEAALADKTPEKLHEWRKQTKYHALQVRLMRHQFPDALLPRLGSARDLSDVLGEVQDIEIVLDAAKGWRSAPSGFRAALTARREQLVGAAERAGKVLFGDKPRAWARLLGARSDDAPPGRPAGKALDRQEA